jgi:ubiquinone/menaquinone biosynthesis C-methylase UbiE
MPKARVDRCPSYVGVEWERTISSPDHPNFWKSGVADLIFLDEVGDKKVVLDLGCGTGGAALSLADKRKAEWIVGVDVVRDMVRVAKEKAVAHGVSDKVCFVVCDGRRLPFRPLAFDGLISRGDAFCFLVPLRNTVMELKRTMKHGGAIVLEIDNQVDWKPGTTISTSILKTRDGKIAYLVTGFTKKRNYTSVCYILDPEGGIVKGALNDAEFREKGHKTIRCSLEEVMRQTVEIRRAAPTHWPTWKALVGLFKRCGFVHVKVMGDGLLMKLLLDGDRAIVEAMKKNPQLFFEIERRLVPNVDADNAPTMILRATAP